jgi:hypothetical protein
MRQGDYCAHGDVSVAKSGEASADRRSGRDDVVHENHTLPEEGSSQPEGSQRVVDAFAASETSLLARFAAALDEERRDARSRASGERPSEESRLVVAPLDQARAMEGNRYPGVLYVELELFDASSEQARKRKR